MSSVERGAGNREDAETVGVASLVGWCLSTGLLLGMAFGWAQALALGWPLRSLVELRLWSDILSYAGAAHGILWATVALLLGLLATLALLLPGVRRKVSPGALSLAFVAASATTFFFWATAAWLGFPFSHRGIHAPWLAIMAIFWMLACVAVYAAASALARTPLGQFGRVARRVTLGPAILLLLVCVGIQWVERPRIHEPTARWKQGPSALHPISTDQTNVVFIVIDTQRADRIGAYGYERPTTPRIDEFAADALVFENATSAAIWTVPSHASMFTGLYPSEHGTHARHTWLDEEFTTLAEILSERGYQTAAFSNNSWVSKTANLTQGFEDVFFPGALHRARGNSISQFLEGVLYPAGGVTSWLGALTSEDIGAKYTPKLAGRWLDGLDGRRPFFLFVNLTEPHWPFRPDLPHRRLFVAGEDIETSYRETLGDSLKYSVLKRDVYSAKQLELMNRTYDGEVRVVDDSIGDLLEVVAERVVFDETLVILTSDHGTHLGEHHLQGHDHSVYQDLTHVPLIVRFPPRVSPGRMRALVQTLDIFPTVLDAVDGGPSPGQSTLGRSLLPPLGTTDPARAGGGDPLAEGSLTGRVVVSEMIATRVTAVPDPRFDRTSLERSSRSVRQGPWKYILNRDGGEELYRIDRDPREGNNLVGQHADIRAALAAQLAKWRESIQPYQGTGELVGGKSVDEEARAQLRALGYVK